MLLNKFKRFLPLILLLLFIASSSACSKKTGCPATYDKKAEKTRKKHKRHKPKSGLFPSNMKGY